MVCAHLKPPAPFSKNSWHIGQHWISQLCVHYHRHQRIYCSDSHDFHSHPHSCLLKRFLYEIYILNYDHFDNFHLHMIHLAYSHLLDSQALFSGNPMFHSSCFAPKRYSDKILYVSFKQRGITNQHYLSYPH